jgi:hypothetical protein
MILIPLYAVSVAGAFIGWYAFGPIKSTFVRGVLRASLVAFLCAPGVLVGHGLAVSPTLFALVAQPSVFTLGSVGIVWLLSLALIFGIPPLRQQQNRLPPSPQTFFIDGFIGKFLLFGLTYAMLLVGLLFSDISDSYPGQILQYALFFGGAAINYGLCFPAVKSKNANPYLTPLLFAAPIFFGAAPTVSLLWYGGGAAGALVAGRHHGLAAGIAVVVFGLLAANSLERSYRAIDAPSHVTIEGGVAGNAAMAALFIILAVVSWWLLGRIRIASHRETTRVLPTES